MYDLNERKTDLLRRIVQSYIETASPVGSSHLVKKYRLKYSPATVRSEMSGLEESGYIMQPHTSAGRVPTDKGYRVYVDCLMKPGRLGTKEQEKIHQQMENSRGDINRLLEEVSRILGSISRELSVVLTPWISWGIFDRLELIELTERKVLAVIHVQSRLVKTIVLELDSDVDQESLEKTAADLNERLNGLTLQEIQDTIGSRLQNVGRGDRYLIQHFAEYVTDIFDFSEPLEVHTCGTQNILMQPEFSDIGMMECILSLVDDRKSLAHLFRKNTKKTEVIIGREHKNDKLYSFAVVTACYNRGKDIGALGVIGPTRMPYSKILPLVDYTAKTMTQYLS
jgi:heat-inducible transcriptional repressor